MPLSKQELHLIQDTSFLLTKVKALESIQELLAATRAALDEIIAGAAFVFPEGTNLVNGKISRGENYRQLPFRILDHPCLFTAGDIFAFRTMFWWGHFFSATLHLQGDSLERHRHALAAGLDRLAEEEEVFVSVGPTPWEYHYGPDNYERLTAEHRHHLRTCEFLKLSRKLELSRWEELPRFAAGFLGLLLDVLRRESGA